MGAWVTTPALIRTMSGTRVTSPVATTSSRAPLTASAAESVCAAAGTSGTAQASNAAIVSLFISPTPSGALEALSRGGTARALNRTVSVRQGKPIHSSSNTTFKVTEMIRPPGSIVVLVSVLRLLE